MSLPPLRHEGPSVPVLPILVFAVPLALVVTSWVLQGSQKIEPLRKDLAALTQRGEASEQENERLAAEVDRLSREVGALRAIAKVDIVWGGASEDSGRIAFNYKRAPGTNSTVWLHPSEGLTTIYYYTDKGDTLGRIAAHARVLGAFHLWPILARENGMKVGGKDALPAGKLVRVPPKIYEAQIRAALTEAGTPDIQRNEIFAQVGLKP